MPSIAGSILEGFRTGRSDRSARETQQQNREMFRRKKEQADYELSRRGVREDTEDRAAKESELRLAQLEEQISRQNQKNNTADVLDSTFKFDVSNGDVSDFSRKLKANPSFGDAFSNPETGNKAVRFSRVPLNSTDPQDIAILNEVKALYLTDNPEISDEQIVDGTVDYSKAGRNYFVVTDSEGGQYVQDVDQLKRSTGFKAYTEGKEYDRQMKQAELSLKQQQATGAATKNVVDILKQQERNIVAQTKASEIPDLTDEEKRAKIAEIEGLNNPTPKQVLTATDFRQDLGISKPVGPTGLEKIGSMSERWAKLDALTNPKPQELKEKEALAKKLEGTKVRQSTYQQNLKKAEDYERLISLKNSGELVVGSSDDFMLQKLEGELKESSQKGVTTAFRTAGEVASMTDKLISEGALDISTSNWTSDQNRRADMLTNVADLAQGTVKELRDKTATTSLITRAVTELDETETGFIESKLNVFKDIFGFDVSEGQSGRDATLQALISIKHGVFGAALSKHEAKAGDNAYGTLNVELPALLSKLKSSLVTARDELRQLEDSNSHNKVGFYRVANNKLVNLEHTIKTLDYNIKYSKERASLLNNKMSDEDKKKRIYTKIGQPPEKEKSHLRYKEGSKPSGKGLSFKERLAKKIEANKVK